VLKRSVFTQHNTSGCGEVDTVRFFAVTGDEGAVVARVADTTVRDVSIALHAPSTPGEESHDDCEFLDGRTCYSHSYGLDAASDQRARLACARVLDGEWGPLLAIYADEFGAPIEEHEVPGTVVVV
jgi:hypothetical protein